MFRVILGMFRIMDRAVQKEDFYIGSPNAERLWGSSVNSSKVFVSFYSSVVSVLLNGLSVLELEPAVVRVQIAACGSGTILEIYSAVSFKTAWMTTIPLYTSFVFPVQVRREKKRGIPYEAVLGTSVDGLFWPKALADPYGWPTTASAKKKKQECVHLSRGMATFLLGVPFELGLRDT